MVAGGLHRGITLRFHAYSTFYTYGYLFLVFVPLPPVIFLLLHEILMRQRWRPARTGALLSAVCAVQYLISSEILASTLLLGFMACVLSIVACRKEFGPKYPYMRTAITYSLLVGGALFAYPVLFALAGPAHIGTIPVLPKQQGDLLGHLAHGPLLWLAPSYSKSIWTSYMQYCNWRPPTRGFR